MAARLRREIPNPEHRLLQQTLQEPAALLRNGYPVAGERVLLAGLRRLDDLSIRDPPWLDDLREHWEDTVRLCQDLTPDDLPIPMTELDVLILTVNEAVELVAEGKVEEG